MFLRLAAAALLLAIGTASGQQDLESLDLRQTAPSTSLYDLDGALTPPRNADAATIALEALTGAALSGPSAATPVKLELAARHTSLEGKLEHLTYTQTFGDAPVFGSYARIHVGAAGSVVRIERSPAVSAPASLAATLSAAEAVSTALGALLPGSSPGPQVDSGLPGGDQRTVLSDPLLLAPAVASRVWFPLAGETRPAWTLHLEIAPERIYQVVVDALSSELLFSLNLVRYQSPTGLVFAAPDVAHPDEGPQTSQPFPGWTFGSSTQGDYANACFDETGDGLCDGHALSVANAFDYPFTNSYDQFNSAAPDRSAAIVNAFYWVNTAHDWLESLGFDEAAGNFEGADAVRVFVQDSNTNNNAVFITPPNGIAPIMQLGLFTGQRRDTAFDGDVMIHEYAHGLTNRLIGGPTNVAGIFLWQSGALGEGWSDAYATSFTGHPVMGEYVTRSPNTGIRSVRYDQNALTYGMFGNRRLKSVPGTGLLIPMPQVHVDGEIWASTLWDLRGALGKQTYEQTLTAALALTPLRPSMLDARDAIVQAAQVAGVGGTNQCALWSVFAARGMGASAALNPIESGQMNDTALSVYEAFDAPTACGEEPSSAGVSIFFDGAEEGSLMTAAGLWHSSNRRAAAGSSAWWFGQDSSANYDTGGRASGFLTTPNIDLTSASGALLEWDQYLQGEGFTHRFDFGSLFAPYLNKDSGRVWISSDDGASWQLLTHLAHNTAGETFGHYRINLTRYAGAQVRIRFDFDTFDAENNDFEGWFVDNIRVSRLSAGDEPELSVSPASLSFIATAGGPVAASQTVSIANAGPGQLDWAAQVVTGSPWLTVSGTSGSGPADLQVAANPAGLSAGQHVGSIEIDAGLAGTQTVTVAFAVTPATTPLAVWSFEEPASGSGVTIIDSSGNGLNGSTAGRGSAPVAGVFGSARLLNGFTDSISAPNAAGAMADRFTIRAWVKLHRYPDNVGIVISTFTGQSYQGWYLAVRSDGHLVFLAAKPPASAPWLVSGGALTLGRWHMLTVTMNRSTGDAHMYVDGLRDNSGRFPGLELVQAGPLTIGKASWFDTYFLNAAVDEMLILHEIQSTNEIAADFAAFMPPPPLPQPAVSAEWNFDQGLLDSSGNGHHAAGDLGTASIPGIVGQARRFDGVDDVVTIASTEQLQPASFTVRAWVRLQATPTPWGALISNYGADFAGWYIGVLESGKAFFGMAAKPSSLPSVESNAALILNRWTHLTATYDGRIQRISLYVDGQLHSKRFVSGMTPRTLGELTLGRASWTDHHYTNFDLDELTIIPRAWTASEVSSDFGAYPVQPTPDPLAHWDFDDLGTGPGTVLFDASSNGLDAVTVSTRTTPVSGVSGVARHFGGWPDSAQVSADAAFGSSSFSFSTWVRIDEYPQNWGVLFSTYDGNFRGWYVGVYSDGRVIFSVSGLPSSNPWVVSSASLELGRWSHITVTFEGASRRGLIYLDGVRVGSAVFPAWTPQVGVQPTFGRASWVNSVYLKCRLDEAYLYPFERSPEDIQAEYGAHSGQQDPTPAAVWEFESAPDEHPVTLNGLTGTVPGQSGNGQLFNVGWGSVAAHPDLSAGTFTWSAWVRLTALPDSWGILYSNYGGDYRGWYAGVHSDGRLIFSVSGLPSSNPWLLSSASLTPGQWHRVAVTFDQISRRGAIYLDGQLTATAVFPAFTAQTQIDPTFARASWDLKYFLSFTIDRARFFKAELSNPQIQALD